MGDALPPALARVAVVLGVLLVVVYVGRLILLDPNRLVVKGSALLSGFVVAPVWSVWLGMCLRGRRAAAAAEAD